MRTCRKGCQGDLHEDRSREYKQDGVLDLPTAIARVTSEPAKILNTPYGRMAVGAPADITVVDPDLEWTVTRTELKSKGKNTPFKGWKMKGRATQTLVAGALVHEHVEGDKESAANSGGSQ